MKTPTGERRRRQAEAIPEACRYKPSGGPLGWFDRKSRAAELARELGGIWPERLEAASQTGNIREEVANLSALIEAMEAAKAAMQHAPVRRSPQHANRPEWAETLAREFDDILFGLRSADDAAIRSAAEEAHEAIGRAVHSVEGYAAAWTPIDAISGAGRD